MRAVHIYAENCAAVADTTRTGRAIQYAIGAHQDADRPAARLRHIAERFQDLLGNLGQARRDQAQRHSHG